MSESMVTSIRQLVMKKIRASAWAQLQKSCWYKWHKRGTSHRTSDPVQKVGHQLPTQGSGSCSAGDQRSGRRRDRHPQIQCQALQE